MARTAATAEKTKKEEQSLAAVSEIRKKYGDGAIFKLGDKPNIVVDVIPTGIIGLDVALSAGGIPRGRITEIYGAESSSKTGTCLQIIASAQKLGLNTAIVDSEQSLDTDLAKLLGVDIDKLFISQPNNASECLDICEVLIKSGEFGLVVLDSVAAMAVVEEINGELGDAIVGRKAKLMAQAMRRFLPHINQSNTAFVACNQLIDNIGSFGYAEQSTTPGGRALKFAASVRIELKRLQQVKSTEDVVIGHKVKASIKKNKVGIPFKVAEYEITYGQNAILLNELLELGVEYKFLEKAGSYYSYNGQRIGSSRANAKQFLVENPNIAKELETKIRGFLGLEVNNA